ncbi:MAG TPA: hypothetical protein VGH28_32650 [Polyangiaceae bacterium]
MFHLKAAHLTAQRVGRALVGRFGLTPARFDLLNALRGKGMRQCDLWRRLNVVRSVISEMVAALLSLEWVKRVRAADGRTWLVMLTRRGRAVIEAAYAECVDNGEATVHMDAGLTNGHVETDAQAKRLELIYACGSMHEVFRATPSFRGPCLYGWHPEDYWTWLTDPNDRTGGEVVPFVDELDF